ncbi:MAG: amidohydrolase/deacetylase family metallohydrolase [Chryseolinea sp.]
MSRSLFIFFLIGVNVCCAFSQTPAIDLLIRNGHVIDPKNSIDEVMDIAVANGRILKVEKRIPVGDAKKVIDASGLFVSPGLIDIHTHVFVGSRADLFADGILSLSPDDFTFKSGVTTVVDAGTSGWRNFPQFKSQVIDKSKTRVLAFINISGVGLVGKPMQEDQNEMQVDRTVAMIREFPKDIVGVKIGHYEGSDWTPFERALSAASQAVVPLLVECHLPEYSLQEQLNRMRPGDIITHAFEKVSERMSVVDDNGNVRDFVKRAQRRGILFDLGHGGAGFWFSEAVPAMKQGLSPYTFGTDLHRFSMNAGMKDEMNVMSKFMALGMSLQDVIVRATANAAKAIRRDDLGSLSVGSAADITIIRQLEGKFGFVDAGGNRIEGSKKLEAELTIRDGKIVWDLNGLFAEPFSK